MQLKTEFCMEPKYGTPTRTLSDPVFFSCEHNCWSSLLQLQLDCNCCRRCYSCNAFIAAHCYKCIFSATVGANTQRVGAVATQMLLCVGAVAASLHTVAATLQRLHFNCSNTIHWLRCNGNNSLQWLHWSAVAGKRYELQRLHRSHALMKQKLGMKHP